MEVKKIIKKRRAYRSLKHYEITDELIRDLAECAGLAPSCFNNQPWRYIFVHDPAILEEMRSALTPGNEWIHNSSMIIAVLSKNDMDCQLKDGREYYAFDVGMATAFLILRATELGLVAHPIAGYMPDRVKEILNVPDEMKVVTLIITGMHSEKLNPVLSDKQVEWEKYRPERLQLEKIYCEDIYNFS